MKYPAHASFFAFQRCPIFRSGDLRTPVQEWRARLHNDRSVRNIEIATEVWNYAAGGSPAVPTLGEKIDAIEVTVGNMSVVIDNLIRYQRNKSVIDPNNYTLTIYDDNGTTPLTVFDLKDENGIASITSIFQRIPQ